MKLYTDGTFLLPITKEEIQMTQTAPIQWTKDVPTEPGFYWVFMGGGLSVAEIFSYTIDGKLTCQVVGVEEDHLPSESEGIWWMGPIDTPELPEESA